MIKNLALAKSVTDSAGDIFDAAYRWALGQKQNNNGGDACTPDGAPGAVNPAAGDDSASTTADNQVVPAADTQDAPADSGSGSVPSVDGLSAEQAKNAATIISVGKKLKIPERGWLVAIMTSLVEAELRNLPHGDADSQGLFQQRPSSGWGTAAQVTDPVYASTAFYGKLAGQGSSKPPGLLQIKGWEAMEPGTAAQKVQISALPDAYQAREQQALKSIKALSGVDVPVDTPPGSSCPPPAGGDGEFANCPASWPSLEKPTGLDGGITPDAMRVLRCGHQKFPQFTQVGTFRNDANAQDHAVGKAIDWMVPGGKDNQAGIKVSVELINWLITNQKALGVHYIIFQNKIWNMERDPINPGPYPKGWRPYSVCQNQQCSPTQAHYDHVHVSVWGNKGVVSPPGVSGKWSLPIKTPYQLGPGVCTTGTVCWGYANHTGQDFAAARGAPVLALSAGTVAEEKVYCPGLSNAQREGNAGCSYGRLLIIDHGGGVQSYYAHLESYASGLKVGDKVSPGQVVAAEGSQGHSTGPHVHVEIRVKGQIINPVPYMEQQGLKPRCSPLMTANFGGDPPGDCG